MTPLIMKSKTGETEQMMTEVRTVFAWGLEGGVGRLERRSRETSGERIVLNLRFSMLSPIDPDSSRSYGL